MSATPKNEAILVRVEMIDGMFDLDDDSKAFMSLARRVIAEAAEKLEKARPAHADVGRFIAAIDALQHAKNLACDAVIIGNEVSNRAKKRKQHEVSITQAGTSQ